MARRKRASMREGPLADLFRSTVDEPSEAETKAEKLDPADTLGQPAPAEPHTPPEPEDVTVYRVEDEGDQPEAAPPGKERLRDILIEDEPGNAAYAREDPHPSGVMAPGGVPIPIIRVIGVGGAGVNAVNRMVEAGVSGVEFLAINTDLQSLQQSMADVTVHIGGEVTRGLGSGSDPELGYKAAFEEQDKIKRLLKGSDMVFVTAGVGGGTGTGAAPVVARLAKTVGALTVGIVTKPFGFEGSRRKAQAEEGVDALGDEVDTLIVVPNERLLSILSRNTSMVEAFRVADDVLRQGVQGIADLVTLPSVINLDFADVRTTMRDAGRAILGIGMGTGDSRATFAAERAISSPILDSSIDGARSILLSITGGEDMSLVEVSEAARVIQEAAHPDAHIIFGANIDEELTEQIWVTVIATRFDSRGRRADGSSRRELRQARAKPSRSSSRPEREVSTPGEARPRDLGIEAPEFEPSR
ncbi:MAG TPA: cell division protein FtsZ [Solirubrobacterales bacterium]|nr:cell division protein FtsZ [Solirubrobacterales bacterium]